MVLFWQLRNLILWLNFSGQMTMFGTSYNVANEEMPSSKHLNVKDTGNQFACLIVTTTLFAWQRVVLVISKNNLLGERYAILLLINSPSSKWFMRSVTKAQHESAPGAAIALADESEKER
jgi:hypothetical protein